MGGNVEKNAYHSEGKNILIWNEFLRIDILQKPLERMTLEALAKCLPLWNVANVFALQIPPVIVVEPLVVVQPDFGQPSGVDAVHIFATLFSGHIVRMTGAEDVPNTRTRNEFQGAATHPSLQIDIYSTVYVAYRVVLNSS